MLLHRLSNYASRRRSEALCSSFDLGILYILSYSNTYIHPLYSIYVCAGDQSAMLCCSMDLRNYASRRRSEALCSSFDLGILYILSYSNTYIHPLYSIYVYSAGDQSAMLCCSMDLRNYASRWRSEALCSSIDLGNKMYCACALEWSSMALCSSTSLALDVHYIRIRNSVYIIYIYYIVHIRKSMEEQSAMLLLRLRNTIIYCPTQTRMCIHYIAILYIRVYVIVYIIHIYYIVHIRKSMEEQSAMLLH
jgi:hypothetical protein